jgi:hypothetical protein
LFFAGELVNLAIGILAVTRTGHRGLASWVPTLHLYFPLGAIAAWKGVIEIAVCPYYWDKTTHGFIAPPEMGEEVAARTPTD